jgi:hypothetical protein
MPRPSQDHCGNHIPSMSKYFLDIYILALSPVCSLSYSTITPTIWHVLEQVTKELSIVPMHEYLRHILRINSRQRLMTYGSLLMIRRFGTLNQKGSLHCLLWYLLSMLQCSNAYESTTFLTPGSVWGCGEGVQGEKQPQIHSASLPVYVCASAGAGASGWYLWYLVPDLLSRGSNEV